MELNLVFEFAIALTIAPLVFCWAIDLAHLIQSIHRGQFREFAKDCTSKTVSAGNHLAIAPDTQSDTKLDQDHLPRPLYASKTVKHYVAEGYPDKLGEITALYPAKKPVTEPLAYHLAALGLGDKELKDLTATQLRKLGARLKIKGAARGRKKDLLKIIRGPNNYA
ncbi:Rho termination factor N-terminal domain-containing protein (plasmid) [Phormidium yuhuli AB48]|jgi:hypothetical protein|uniref:Rho termination factor N-terminal domain-containing protein n=1 Tax=Phormidium yuhuli AB48 TaxID=2940671 RepID=A0ABY5AVG3_9CYAN|nr:Rho termination factor N-terminal domain-containing protein [Phormidium yuhuli]USR93268.1 Rho termination factor N-terminal domain-containing protein [Phormidium yuhuli AB48]